MKKFHLLLLFLVIAGFQMLHAQGVQIIGKVTGSEDGLPIVGATVMVKGTTVGIVTDYQGKYVITVPPGSTTLIISFVGLITQEIPIEGKTTIDVVMQPEVTGMQEVVVTAYGIKRSAKELGYATSKVTSKEINEAGVSNVVNGLEAKVAGLEINTINNGVNPDTKITLRGNRHLLGNNQALVVLDGVPVSASYLNSINPNDIENVNILKGASASALYGNDASNGVLIITTKRGGADKKPVVRVSNTTTFESVSFFPGMQTKFGSGSSEDTAGYALTSWVGPRRTTYPFTPFENQSYGPAYNGQMVKLGGPLPDGSQQMVRYSYVKDNKKNFFVTGVTNQNDISYSQGDENSSFFLSAQDVNTTGTVPKDTKRRDGVRFAGARTYNFFHAEYSLGYTQTNTNTSGGGFFQNRPVYWNVMNTPGEVPLDSYSDIVNNKYANENGYFNAYYQNPYWQVNHSRQITRTDDLLGSALLRFTPASWFDVSYRAGMTFRNNNYNSYKDAVQFAPYWSSDPWGAGDTRSLNAYIPGASADNANTNLILTGDLLMTFTKKFNDFSTKLILGNSVYSYKYRYLGLSADQLVVDNFYNVTNVVGAPNYTEYKQNRNSVGLFGDLSLGYKDMIFLHFSGRNDWDSRLVKANRSFFYPGADLSLILSDLVPSLKDNSVLSFAKLRTGWSRTGQVSLDNFYATLPAFAAGTRNYSGNTGFPFPNSVGFQLSSTLSNPTLKPEQTTEIEGGIDLGLFQNKINLNVSLYQSKTINQTIPASISPSTGYTAAFINAGELDSKGVEVDLKFAPLISAGKFSWSPGFTFSYTKTLVASLLPGLSEISIGNSNYATVGQQYPLIKVTDFLRDSVGRIIVDAKTGLPAGTDSKLKSMGHGNPNIVLGVVNTFTFGRFSLGIVTEFRSGNVIYNQVGNDLTFSGIGWNTGLNDRQSFVIPNSSIKQVNPVNGHVTYVANTGTVVNDAGYNLWTNSPAGSGGAQVMYVNSAAFIKIREVTLNYDLPVEKLWGGRVIKAAQIGFIGRNLFMFLPKQNQWADPEFNASVSGLQQNAVGYTTGDQTPATRFLGFKVDLTF